MPNSNTLPTVTIVLPVLNEGRFLEQTLEQLITQDYPEDSLEILVVDGGSEDNTKKIVNTLAEKHPNITLLQNPKRRSSAGRNRGFKEGRGDYFVVIDGHCYIPNDQLIKNVVNAFQKSGADCLGRPQQLDPPGLTDFQKAVAVARAASIGHSGASFIYSNLEGFISPQSNGAAYKREVFEQVGYVDEDFDAAEDLEFNYRVEKAGLSCYTSPQLMVKYYPRESIPKLFKQLTRYGRGRCRFIKKHPDTKTINQLIPFAFVLGLFLALGCSLLMLFQASFSVLLFLPVLPYILYVLVICTAAVVTCMNSSIRYLFVLPFIFFTIHYSLGWGFLKELLIRRNVRD